MDNYAGGLTVIGRMGEVLRERLPDLACTIFDDDAGRAAYHHNDAVIALARDGGALVMVSHSGGGPFHGHRVEPRGDGVAVFKWMSPGAAMAAVRRLDGEHPSVDVARAIGANDISGWHMLGLTLRPKAGGEARGWCCLFFSGSDDKFQAFVSAPVPGACPYKLARDAGMLYMGCLVGGVRRTSVTGWVVEALRDREASVEGREELAMGSWKPLRVSLREAVKPLSLRLRTRMDVGRVVEALPGFDNSEE